MKNNKFVVFLIVITVVFIGYCFSVGIVFCLQWLINAAFQTSFDVNLWWGGLLFYIIYLIFKE